jgi:hypothetical protein
MTPGQLVKAMSIATGVPLETVTQHDRNLAMAGLRTMGGRGPSAAHVTALDAARLLAAILGSIRTMDSVETVRSLEDVTFRHLPPGSLFKQFEQDKKVDVAIDALPRDHNWIEGLAALITAASRPIDDLQSFLERFSQFDIRCYGDTRASIGGHRVALADYDLPWEDVVEHLTDEERKELMCCRSGMSQSRQVPGTTIMLLGAAFRDNGLRYASAKEAYLAGYGIKSDKPKKSAKSEQRVKRV